VKDVLTNEHKLYRPTFAEGSVDHQWDRVVFCDKSAFNSANERLDLVYRLLGECYNSQYVQPPHAVVVCVCVCVFIVEVGSPMKGLEYSIIYKNT
jgi:hypothetical protein